MSSTFLNNLHTTPLIVQILPTPVPWVPCIDRSTIEAMPEGKPPSLFGLLRAVMAYLA
jgi:hypothetical protein